MPHDKNGNKLNIGDEVILRCKITQISEGVESQCNVTAEALERPEGEGYIPTITGNSRFYTSVEPFISNGTEPKDIPAGLVRHDDGVWQMPTKDHEIVADKMQRQALDFVLQAVKNLPPSRERSLARTKIEEAIMWLGMDLKRLGTPNPYPNSKDPSNTIVDATADGLKL